MSDGDAILLAILDEPGEDVHRLVYADWLEDNGQPERAEFIRLQLAIANEERDCSCGRKGGNHKFQGGQHHNGPCAGDQLRVEVGGKFVRAKMREHALLMGSQTAPLPRVFDWLADMPGEPFSTDGASNDAAKYVDGQRITYDFRRGFIYKISCHIETWMNHGKAICSVCPVETINVLGVSPMDNSTWGRNDSVVSSDDQINTETLPPSPSRLPRAVWDRLEGYDGLSVGVRVVDGPNNKHYRGGKESAMKALSRACLVYARQLTQSPTAKV